MKLLRRPPPMSPVARLSEHEQALLSIENVHCPPFVEDVGRLPLRTVHERLARELSELPLSEQVVGPSSDKANRALVLLTDIERIVFMQKQLAGYGICLSLENPEINP